MLLRLLAAALMLITALPNAALLCNTWCASDHAEERCQHADAAGEAAVNAAHDCRDSLVGAPSLNERTITVSHDVRALLTSVVDASPLMAWVPRRANDRAAAHPPHVPLKTILRI